MLATAAAIGNPPQPFRLLVDLAWDTLFVPSSRCDDDICKTHIFRYTSNESSTHEPGGPLPWISYGGVHLGGNITFDTLRIAGLEIPRQPFMEVLQAREVFIGIYYDYDVGL